MAGRDHHFIPQLLQKGFSAGQTKKGKHQVWVFRRGMEPFLTGTVNSFVERDFYGPPSAPVDQLITDDEGRLDGFVTRARAAPGDAVLGTDDPAADFVLQISIRSRWIRDFGRAAGNRVVDAAHLVFSGKAGLTIALKRMLEKEPGWLLDELINQAKKLFGRPLTHWELNVVLRAEAQVRAHPELLAEFGPTLPPLEMLREAVDQAAVAGHLKGLERSMRARATKYREFLSKMEWSVAVTHESPLSLGDCGPVFLEKGGGIVGPMGIGEQDQHGVVVLPISSTHFLFGRVNSDCPEPSAVALNEAAAYWSSEAFITAALTDENKRLQAMLGSKLEPFFESQMNEVLKDYGIKSTPQPIGNPVDSAAM